MVAKRDPLQARRLEYWRRKRRLSKTDLAVRVGVHKSTMSRWTAGQRMMPASLEKVLAALGITARQYFGTLNHRAI